MKINPRHYTLILFAIMTVVASVFSYVFLYKKTVAQAEHYARATQEVSNESSKKQHEQELIKIHNETIAGRAKISSFLIAEDTAVYFIETVEKVGTDSQTDLQLSSISSDDTSIKAKVDVKGTWSGVMSALMLFENIPLSIVLNDIRLVTSGDLESSDKKTSKAHTWHLSLIIEALTKKPTQ